MHAIPTPRSTIAMDAPKQPRLPEVLLGVARTEHLNFNLAGEGVQRYV